MTNFELYVKALLKGETVQQLVETGFDVTAKEFSKIQRQKNEAFAKMLKYGELF